MYLERLKNRENKGEMEIVILVQMTPENHLRRRIDRTVNFSFFADCVSPSPRRGAPCAYNMWQFRPPYATLGA